MQSRLMSAVEATANVVGQAELWMAALTTAAVLVYARARLVPSDLLL